MSEEEISRYDLQTLEPFSQQDYLCTNMRVASLQSSHSALSCPMCSTAMQWWPCKRFKRVQMDAELHIDDKMIKFDVNSKFNAHTSNRGFVWKLKSRSFMWYTFDMHPLAAKSTLWVNHEEWMNTLLKLKTNWLIVHYPISCILEYMNY